jgi:hypothetical protein
MTFVYIEVTVYAVALGGIAQGENASHYLLSSAV